MAIRVKVATILAVGGPSSSEMDTTDDAVRQQVRRLIELGVSQKVLAKYVGENEAWISRWLNRKGTITKGGAESKPPVINAHHMDRLGEYLAELADVIEDAPPQVASAARLLNTAKQIVVAADRLTAISTLQQIIQTRRKIIADAAAAGSSPAAHNIRRETEMRHARKGSSEKTDTAPGRIRRGMGKPA
jgi:hypothetical protein